MERCVLVVVALESKLWTFPFITSNAVFIFDTLLSSSQVSDDEMATQALS